MSDFSHEPDLSSLTAEAAVSCPYCWETIELVVDLSVPEQTYIEDCHVCCKPIVVSYTADSSQLEEISVRPENE